MLSRKNNLISVARTTRYLIRISAFFLVAIYSWLNLKNIPIGQTLGSISAEIFLKTSLVIYFLSWVAGAFMDTNDQEMIYTSAPHKGNLPWPAIFLIILISIVFGILCYVQSSTQFSIVLAIYLIINFIGWLYLTKKYLPQILADSKEDYLKEDQLDKLLKLEIFIDYQLGLWQYWRFAIGGILIALIILLSFSNLPIRLEKQYNIISSDTYLSLAVLIYVFTMEAWIWAMRLKNRISRGTVTLILDKISTRIFT